MDANINPDYVTAETTDGTRLLIVKQTQSPPPPQAEEGYEVTHLAEGVYVATPLSSTEVKPAEDQPAQDHVEGTDGLDV